ncbi:DeoR/GlpR family DNA-binding transcription regulator [Gorillibacterium sp. sgz5001074]|uniref:DeoR/GlpR family DNA-binding transcription regulator n=1 Tax=Gorillibacterium sp. sgz5001074 TaxID=3446695 RepID=UPI003F6741AB
MFQEDRLLRILESLKRQQSMSVQEICTQFGISRDTARRDIVKLVGEGVVQRTHGGIALPRLQKEIASYHERLVDGADHKKVIGAQAARMIKDYETIILDASTTVQCAAEQMEAKHVTVITHSIDNMGLLAERVDTRVYVLGGYLDSKSRLFTGASVLEKLRSLHADKALIGAAAITSDGIFYPYEEDVVVKREMARRSDQVIVVADSSKFARRAMFHLEFDCIDVLISDREVPSNIREVLEQHQITVIVCDAKSYKKEECSHETTSGA